MSYTHDNLDEPADFSLVLGGPLYQFYLRTGLVKPPLNLYKRRIVGISQFAWLPLLPFSRGTIVQLVILTAWPLFPLTLTMIPLEEMIDHVGVFF